MDTLSQHEAFLRAIYDSPEDDTPRLVYADFLEEHGDPDKAAYVRYECEMQHADAARLNELHDAWTSLIDAHEGSDDDAWPWNSPLTTRGFPSYTGDIILEGASLADPATVRSQTVRSDPNFYGAAKLRLRPPAIRPEHVAGLFALPFVSQVREWDLSGHVEEMSAGPETDDGGAFGLIDMIEEPVITAAGVEAMCEVRALRRVEVLTLTHNNLDNDAARALVRCPYLANLRKLELYDGNRFRGKTWAQLVERFGEGVVG
jgi:uncharacterized protein (TIGR02996 family)